MFLSCLILTATSTCVWENCCSCRQRCYCVWRGSSWSPIHWKPYLWVRRCSPLAMHSHHYVLLIGVMVDGTSPCSKSVHAIQPFTTCDLFFTAITWPSYACSVPTNSLLVPASRLSVPVVSELDPEASQRRWGMEQNGRLQRRALNLEEAPGTRVGHAMVTLESKVTSFYITILHLFSSLAKSLDANLTHVCFRYLYMEDTRSPWWMAPWDAM